MGQVSVLQARRKIDRGANKDKLEISEGNRGEPRQHTLQHTRVPRCRIDTALWSLLNAHLNSILGATLILYQICLRS